MDKANLASSIPGEHSVCYEREGAIIHLESCSQIYVIRKPVCYLHHSQS